MMDVELTLNGVAERVTCAPGDTLLTVLRRLGCFSVRFGSGTGETGAAAVLMRESVRRFGAHARRSFHTTVIAGTAAGRSTSGVRDWDEWRTDRWPPSTA